jgi:TonB family protein
MGKKASSPWRPGFGTSMMYHRNAAPPATNLGGCAMNVAMALALIVLNGELGSSSIAANRTVVPVVQELSSIDPGIGTLNVVVQDAQGGAIPGADVRLTQDGTSNVRTLKTDGRGRLSAADLSAPRTYDIAVSLPGFRTTRDRVHMVRGQTITRLVQLNVGTLAETVTVSSEYNPVYSAGQAAPGSQVPAVLQTADDFFAAAKVLYEQGRFADAVAMNARAVAIERADTPRVPMTARRRLSVGGHVTEPRKIRHLPPIYPAYAALAGIEGTVILDAVIDKEGTVRDVVITRSAPMLDDAALHAVRIWGFTPALLNGVPVEVAMTVTMNFVRR